VERKHLAGTAVEQVEESVPGDAGVMSRRVFEENTQGLTDETPAPSFNRFLDLPPEIRVMIYEYLLVVGKVFPTQTRTVIADTQTSSIPSLALIIWRLAPGSRRGRESLLFRELVCDS
jgi:hypothetical protein